MNLSEIVANVNAELSPATNLNVLIKKWANKAQQAFISTASKIAPFHNFSWLALTELTLTTVANQYEYALSPMVDLGKAITIYTRTTPRKIEVMVRNDLIDREPDFVNTTGNPDIAYLSGFTPVENQPTSASTLSLVSTAADTAVVKIDGLTSAGVLIGEEVTLNGTIPVVTTNSYSRILGRGINGYLNGILTITSNGGTVTNAVIGPRDRQRMYPRLVFYPVPSGAETIYYDAYMRLPDLVNDNDFSLIPDDYHDGIEHYCLYRGYRHKKDMGSSQEAKQAFEDVVMRAINNDKGPKKKIVIKSWSPEKILSTGRLPSNYPRSW